MTCNVFRRWLLMSRVNNWVFVKTGKRRILPLQTACKIRNWILYMPEYDEVRPVCVSGGVVVRCNRIGKMLLQDLAMRETLLCQTKNVVLANTSGVAPFSGLAVRWSSAPAVKYTCISKRWTLKLVSTTSPHPNIDLCGHLFYVIDNTLSLMNDVWYHYICLRRSR